MNDPDHALAARHHADRASSGSHGDDPAVLVGLAQAEALLAVAAAIDRLAGVLSERNPPQPSPAQGQGYQVAEVRRQHPNAYTPWTAEADAALLAAYQAGHDVAALADTFGRQPSAIRARLNHLGAHSTSAGPTNVGTGEDTCSTP
ncbi:MAG TPA: hypothetical protein VMV92_17990 [Streptosporangiaceae bacterium]|nr:hypothetical protein [Streptosporangiaceae bacterium]